MVPLGTGAERKVDDYALTRYACYLIAQNGDPSKDPIAFAQTYFAVQTRKQELIEPGAMPTLVVGMCRVVWRHFRSVGPDESGYYEPGAQYPMAGGFFGGGRRRMAVGMAPGPVHGLTPGQTRRRRVHL